jgi:hypothetical protein
MRFSALFLTGLALVSATAGAQQMPVADDPHWHLKQERIDAYRKGDRAYFEAVLAADFVGLGPDGRRQGKKDYLAAEFGEGQRAALATQTEVSGFRSIVAGEMLVLSYDEQSRSRVGEQAFTERLARLDVYRREAGKWRLQTMTAVRLPEAPNAITMSAQMLGSYAGDYAFAADLVSAVRLEGGRLTEQTSGQQKVELIPIGPDLFYAPPDLEARVSFERDGAGRIVAQVYKTGSQTFRGARRP